MTPDRAPDSDRSRTAGEAEMRSLAGRRVVVGLGLALVAVTAAFGAVLGYALPARSGIETLAVAGVSVPVSPVTMALYGVLAVGTLLAVGLLALHIVSRFDENAE
ncbi:hypothetical protein ACFO5R_22020 [Halosolutus amylolyticus]|uniref:Cox cluster protein n=1 Tax=Halosolutus amylolyticus TaxID=2932267 RepID=A0ABD5PWA1_9EURY|nr:hypothetical protein [Halosolutus amylolyticus]